MINVNLHDMNLVCNNIGNCLSHITFFLLMIGQEYFDQLNDLAKSDNLLPSKFYIVW